MMPIGPLMIEHRLIERMIAVARTELSLAEKQREISPVFVNAFTDFIRTYADRCHHGKEEDILFRDLRAKQLAAEHARTMEELIAEHRWGREKTAQIVRANLQYLKGGQDRLPEVLELIRALIDFYPKHIEKEDQRFFLPVMRAFSKQEQEAMLAEEREFDRDFIHQHYKSLIAAAEKDPAAAFLRSRSAEATLRPK
jgi:hemerythrin-like domain-containing protein